MGACVSTWMNNLESDHDFYLSTSSAANVITISGQLRQFPVPITVSQLLVQLDSSPSLFFICNSDSLYYHQHVPALNSTHQLQSAQIYFILPKSKLDYPLSASDMAALAAKASTAISSMNANSNTKSKISPLMASILSASEEDINENMNTSTKNKKSSGVGLGISRTGSMGKLQRYSTARRAKLTATRSFHRLTTIHEASHLQAY